MMPTVGEPTKAESVNDTSADAERIQMELLRRSGPQRRSAMMLSLTDVALTSARRAIARAHPEASDDERKIHFVRLHYGDDLANEYAAYLAQRSECPTPIC